jgi:hypothetical protein
VGHVALRPARVAGSSPPVEAVAGRIGRRRALPNGRAVLGAFAVAVAAVLVFAAALHSRSGAGQAWIVARTELPAGTRLAAGDLTTTTLKLGSGPAAGDAFAGPAGVVGRTLAVSVGPGDLVLRSELSAAGATPSLRPVPVSVVSDDLVDLGVGDLVDVVVTTGQGTSTATSIVLRGARVLGTAQPSGSLVGASGDDVVTLGVHTLAEVEVVIRSEHDGTVDLVVGEPADGSGPGQ